MDATLPAPLRRVHSLEFLTNQDTKSDSLDDLDIHAAAQMVELFDVDQFLNDVSTPVSNTPGPHAVKLGNLIQAGSPFLPELSGVELTEIVSGRDVSKASDDAASEVTGSAPVANMAAVETKKTQRKTRKDEVIELRQSVKELTDHSRPTPPLWKYAAIRQLGRRRKAEEDNVMLREMLEMQVQEAKCLQRILKRRTKIQMMEDMLGMKRYNSQIFMTMLRETDKIYSRVDSHFIEKGVVELPCPGLERKVNRSAINGVVFEMKTRNLLPFSLQKTGKTARVVLNDIGTSGLKRIKDINTQIDFHARESEESRDTLVASYFSATPGNPNSSGAQVQKVMRMYVEEDCAVFIWKMVAEPKLRGSNAPIGYQLQSTLQVVMRPGETPTLTGDESTQLLIHFSASRHDTGVPISAEFREPGYMDGGIAVWEKLISQIPQEIESELIDDMCNTIEESNAEMTSLMRNS
ncbi:hypothetical protein GQ600_27039 [Phytophthora cactorum]|nr:hypothetical protein GQ600_27039 [Phytophthora cactorum]